MSRCGPNAPIVTARVSCISRFAFLSRGVRLHKMEVVKGVTIIETPPVVSSGVVG
jgi:hypothetical protein